MGVLRVRTDENLDVPQTARLVAEVNVVGADAMIAMMHAKYHFQFWRPVTAIDPGSVTNDGLGPVPGFDDGNPLTVEQPGWRPLLPTPNHPEYPSAHGCLTSALTDALAAGVGTDHLDITVPGATNGGTTLTTNQVFNNVQNIHPTKTLIKLTKLTNEPNDGFQFKGVLDGVPTPPSIDPLTRGGLRVILETSPGGAAFSSTTLSTAPAPCATRRRR